MAREQVQQLFTATQSIEEPVLLLQAHRVMGVPSFFLGEEVTARAYLEKAISPYDPQKPYFPVY